jgi:hypothetical protein
MSSTDTYEPDIIIYPFHAPMPDMDDLYHVRCSKHPGFYGCYTLEEAGAYVQEHLRMHSRLRREHAGD